MSKLNNSLSGAKYWPLIALSGCCVNTYAIEKLPVKKPNIVLIMADDMGYSDIGCYGFKVQNSCS